MRHTTRSFLGFASVATHARRADICPVYEGMMVSPGARRIELGGADLDLHTQQLLKARCALVTAPLLLICEG